VRFCYRSEDASWIRGLLDQEYIDIDLASRRVIAPDITEHIELVRTDRYFGMLAPLPMLIPKLDSHSWGETETRITHEDLSLVFRPIDRSTGEFVGQMSRTLAGGARRRVLTYRYSARNGVAEFVTDIGVSSPELLRWCGGAKLFPQAI
jgi:hypothetical protein